MFNFDTDGSNKNLFADIVSKPNISLFPTAVSTVFDKPGSLFVSTTGSSLFESVSTTTSISLHSAVSVAAPSFSNVVGCDAPSPLSPRHLSSRSLTSWPAVKLSRLPVGFNRKTWLHQYFSRFGNITRIICQPPTDSAFIAYETVTSAQRAKRHAHESPPSPTAVEPLPRVVLLTLSQCHSRTRTNSDEGALQLTEQNTTPADAPIVEKSHPVEPTVELFKGPTLRSSLVSNPCDNVLGTKADAAVPKRVTVGSTVEECAGILQTHYKMERERKRLDVMAPEQSFLDSYSADFNGLEDTLDVRFSAIRGTCMDMCPELERYLRELHQRVSIFECLPSTLAASSNCGWQMDHTRAVKDYVRSSADQPAPLPCELRPTPVLRRTMAYLLASIADRSELDTTRSLWKPWYEFMWTRTRAIRKDVAQQRLCCPVIVSVMERIARFHIFCAARLVDQSIDSFDPRINSENLTQCLQTLKEMYNDLESTRSDSSVVCPREAEFRAYMLLMNLNDQSALNDVQNLPSRLLRSAQVRFAVSVHEAVTTNNYVRFFRLAMKADCLSACLLHRYFVQMRSQALLRLSTSFAGHPKKDVQYPLSVITRQLGFENTQQAQAFCAWWGLHILDDCVVFGKQSSLLEEKLPWREQRAFRLIENKRSGVPLSELFNGEPVTNADAIPVPVQSSFDQQGVFIVRSDDDLEVDSAEHPVATPPPNKSIQTLKPTLFTNLSEPSAPAPFETKYVHLAPMIDNSQRLGDFVDEWIRCNLDCNSVAIQTFTEEAVALHVSEELVRQAVDSECSDLAKSMLDTEHQSLRTYLQMEVYDRLTQEVLTDQCLRLSRALYTLESITVDLFRYELLPSSIRSVVRSCWFRAQSDRLCRRFLFRRFCHIAECKRRDRLERLLIRSLPACPDPHLNALTLVNKTVRYPALLSETDQLVTHSCFLHAKRPRFSRWSVEIDNKVTWQPMICPSSLTNCSIGVCTVSTLPHSRELSSVLTAWIRVKLSRLPITFIPPDISFVAKFAALICLGSPNDLFSRHASNLGLPILAFIPVNSITVENSLEVTSSVHSLSLPYKESEQLRPNPTWSLILTSGLDWLASKFSQSEIDDRPSAKMATHPVRPSRNVLTLIRQFIDLNFLRPLALLAHIWRKQDMVDPSPVALFDAYHRVLIQLLDHILSPSLAALVRPHLVLPSECVELLVNDSCDQLADRWSKYANQLGLTSATKLVLQSALINSQKRVSSTTVRSANGHVSVLAPWLKLCLVTVYDRLENLLYCNLDSFPHENDAVSGLLCRILSADEQQALTELATHFSTLGEPRMTYSEAISQYWDAWQQKNISSVLNTPCRDRFSHIQSENATTFSPVSYQIGELQMRIEHTENSMLEALDETNICSRLSLMSSNPISDYSVAHPDT